MSSTTSTVLIERPRVEATTSIYLQDKQLARAERRPGHQRRYAPKTRTGCITCKIRRVKCGEEKPHCKRCTTTGRKCDGYAIPAETPNSSRCSESLSPALVTDISSDALERRTFDFFRATTAPCVAGYFTDPLWERIVLQMSHSEPAVRHAVNALGALHEEKFLRKEAGNGGVDVSLVKTSFPIQQYSKALKEMQALLTSNNVSLDVVLVCALVCIHFEALRESFVPALMHIENAIKLLHSKTGTLDARKVNPSLVRAVMRVDLQGAMYLNTRVPGLSFYTAATDSILPQSFHDLTQARDLINTWSCRVFHFMRTIGDEYKLRNVGNIPLEHVAQALELENVCIELDRLLFDFMHKPSVKLSAREQHGLGMLRSRVKVNRIQAATCLYSEQTRLDVFVPVFDEIVTICSYIMGSDNTDKRLFSIGMDEGLVFPFYFVVFHCRDGRIRHTALDLLSKLPSHDGTRHVQTALRTCEVLIDFEERLCDKAIVTCEDIPEWRRVHAVNFGGWLGEGAFPAVKVTLRTRPNGLDGEWLDVEENVPWSVPGETFNENFAVLMAEQQHKLQELSCESPKSTGG